MPVAGACPRVREYVKFTLLCWIGLALLASSALGESWNVDTKVPKSKHQQDASENTSWYVRISYASLFREGSGACCCLPWPSNSVLPSPRSKES